MFKNGWRTLIIIMLLFVLSRYKGLIFRFILNNSSLRRVVVTMAMRVPGVRKYLLQSF
ncbi:hypothetical protein J2S78_002124 [Salibacterium salarium]|uniref:hypothetical protein n=1 Tax=Salibacterium salarium TaxID=284579 RepID=UPI00277E635D|nr:hypothetical protein [Salibacterium salarium]MDQ0299704.1 hypothetical protein [Salibacterium salarium]